MVLPERIGLSTSPLPRECSTTELRQLIHASKRALATGSAHSQQASTPYQHHLDRALRRGKISAMTNTPANPDKIKAAQSRKKKLAEALRTNLKRRKAADRAPSTASKIGKP